MTRLAICSTVTVDGVAYTMKPSFAAINSIEATTGKGFFKLAQELNSGEFMLSDMAQIIHAGIKYGERCGAPSKERIGNFIVSEGIESFIEPVILFFKIAIAGEATSDAK